MGRIFCADIILCENGSFSLCSGCLILEWDSSILLCSQQLNTQGWFPRQIKRGWKERRISMEEALLLRIKLGCGSGKQAHVDSAVRSLICEVCVFVLCCATVCVCVAVPWPPVPDHVSPQSDGPLHQSLHGHAPAPVWVGPEAERNRPRL